MLYAGALFVALWRHWLFLIDMSHFNHLSLSKGDYEEIATYTEGDYSGRGARLGSADTTDVPLPKKVSVSFK